VSEVLNGIFYILWTGCQWKALPKDLPRELRRLQTFFQSSPSRALLADLSVAAKPKFIRLRMPEDLNTMTRRGEVGTSLPVFRLRPMRWPFLRTISESKDAV
jgi:hypothetical protein